MTLPKIHGIAFIEDTIHLFETDTLLYKMLYPDTSAAAFPPKSTFAFTLQVKPGTFQNPFHLPIGSASVDFQPFFNCGL
jgi:hypothetical protein